MPGRDKRGGRHISFQVGSIFIAFCNSFQQVQFSLEGGGVFGSQKGASPSPIKQNIQLSSWWDPKLRANSSLFKPTLSGLFLSKHRQGGAAALRHVHFILLKRFIHSFGVCLCMCVPMCPCGDQRTSTKQFQRSDSACWAWQQAGLPTEPSQRLHVRSFLSHKDSC